MNRKAHILLLIIIYSAFISLGLPDSVLGSAWPVMGPLWGVPLESAGLVTMVLTLAAALSGFASGRVLKRFGTGLVVLLSGVLTGGALLGFSFAPSFWWLPVLALPLGFGAGSVDAGLNDFVAHHYSSRHMNWLHGFWGLGATAGPLIMGAALVSSSWRSGYFIISLIQLTLAVVFLISLPLWKKEAAIPLRGDTSVRHSNGSPPVWAPWTAPLLFFFYTAVEGGTGLWAATILVNQRGFQPAEGAFLSAGFFGFIMGGRFTAGLISEKLGNRAMVRLGIGVALAGCLLFTFSGSSWILSFLALGMMGLGCAPIYPGLMHETPNRFQGDTAKKVIGRQVAFASLGGVLLPPGLGAIGSAVGLWVILPGIGLSLLILFFLSEILNRRT